MSEAPVVEIRSASPSRSPGGYRAAVTRGGGFVGARRRRLVSCVLLVLAVAGAAEAQPTQLTVRVRKQDGSPISLATVCMAQGSQTGSRLTDSQGVAVLTGLPAGAYTLYVFTGYFQTKSQSVNLAGTQEQTVTLLPGASTPPAGVNCQAGALTTLAPITITSFTVDNLPADFKVTAPPATHLPLRATFDRAPAFYRIVEGSGDAYTTPLQNLQTVSWQPILAPNAPFIYLFPIDFTKPFGTRVVYLQVNSVASESGASQIKSVSVVLTPAQLQTTVLTGAALQGFLDRAQQVGYGPVTFKNFRTVPDLRVCRAGRLPGLPQIYDLGGGVALECNSDSDCPFGSGFCRGGVCRRPLYFPSVGWIPAPDQLFSPDSQPPVGSPKTLIETAEFRAFTPPHSADTGRLITLMPFWKITDLVAHHAWLGPGGGGMFPGGSISVIESPPLQPPERIIRVERTTRFDTQMNVVCLAGAGLPSTPLPSFRSVTVVGPKGRDPREAFGPLPDLSPFQIQPGRIRRP